MSSYRTVGEILRRCVDGGGHRPFVLDGTQAISYAEFTERIARVAFGLYKYDVRPGTRVALMLESGQPWLETFFAAAHLGALIVPIDPSFKADEVDCILADSEASILVTDCRHGPMLERLYEERLTLRRVFCTGQGYGDFDTYASLREANPLIPEVDVTADQPLTLNYTSGTTGRPRGVLLTHANYDYTSEAVAAAIGLRGDDRLASLLAPCHVSSQILGPMAVIQRGATLHMPPALPLQSLMHTVEHSRATVLALPVALVGRLSSANGIDAGLAGRLRMVITTGAAVLAQTHRCFEERFGMPLVTCYGLTEACGVSAINGPKAHRREIGSCGKPLDGQRLRVVGSDDDDRHSFSVGEIALRGPNLMVEYLDEPEATARKLRAGWLRTGDLGYIDEEGFMYLIGRKKDLVVRGGQHIYPAEVEDVLQRHPAVAEAAVIGVYDPRQGQELAAFIVVRDGHHLSAAEAIAFCRDHLATYKCPGLVEQRQVLPKTPTGHVRKSLLAQHYSTLQHG